MKLFTTITITDTHIIVESRPQHGGLETKLIPIEDKDANTQIGEMILALALAQK